MYTKIKNTKILNITASTTYISIQNVREEHFYSIYNSFDCQSLINNLSTDYITTELWIDKYLTFILNLNKICYRTLTHSFMDEIISIIFNHIIQNKDRNWHNLFMNKKIKTKLIKLSKKIYKESQLDPIPISPTFYKDINPLQFIDEENIDMFSEWFNIYFSSIKTQSNKKLASDSFGFNFSNEIKNKNNSLKIYKILMEDIQNKKKSIIIRNGFHQGILAHYHFSLMAENYEQKNEYSKSYHNIIKNIYNEISPNIWDIKEVGILSHQRNLTILKETINKFTPIKVLLWMCKLFNNKQQHNKNKLNALFKNIIASQHNNINMLEIDLILINILTHPLTKISYYSIKNEIIESLIHIPNTKAYLIQQRLNKTIPNKIYLNNKITKI